MVTRYFKNNVGQMVHLDGRGLQSRQAPVRRAMAACAKKVTVVSAAGYLRLRAVDEAVVSGTGA
jgi:hypothetical protein